MSGLLPSLRLIFDDLSTASGTEISRSENHDRLGDVKTEYDPENLFRLNQNIAPDAGEV